MQKLTLIMQIFEGYLMNFVFAKWYNTVRRHIRPPCQRTSRGRIKQLRTTRQAAALVKLSMTGFMKVLLA